MIVNYKAKNLEISESLKDYCEKGLAKFDKLIGVEKATVAMTCIRDRQRIEITIPYNGVVIRGEEEGFDMYTCIDKVSEKLESQIHKYRTRLIKRGRGASRPEAAIPDTHWLEDDEPVKVKTFPTKPMSTEEAIMEMNLLGHSFFVFYNEQNQVNVLYRRRDGEYGLLTPEV